jgi:hypothetical protein
MHSIGGAAPGAALLGMSARAQASRLNGARSRGPRSAEGKARSSQNALKHGLRAQKVVVLPEEDARAYEAHEAALVAELAPEGALQTLFVRRVVAAAWRLERAERMEVELFENQRHPEREDLGLALIRDANGARAFPILLRYRGAAEAGLWRALRALKALQAEAGQAAEPARPPRAIDRLDMHAPGSGEQREVAGPNEPESRANPGFLEPFAADRPEGSALGDGRRGGGAAVPARDLLLPQRDVEGAPEDDDAADPGEHVRHLAKREIGDRGHPDQLGEVDRHDDAGVGEAEGFRHQVLPAGAEQADQGEPEELLRARPLPDEEGRDERERQQQQRHVGDDGEARLGAAQALDHQEGEGPGERR